MLNARKTVHVYEPGQVIFHQGNPSFAVYCIHEGRVKVYKSGERGRQQVIRLLGPTDMVGFRALIAEEPYAATAEALTQTTACVVDRDLFQELLRTIPDFTLKIMKKLAAELRVSEEAMFSIAHRSVKERVARFLLSVTNDSNEEKSNAVDTLRRTEIAQIIGTTPETLSRTLHLFDMKGWIRVSRTAIEVLDREPIKKTAKI